MLLLEEGITWGRRNSSASFTGRRARARGAPGGCRLACPGAELRVSKIRNPVIWPPKSRARTHKMDPQFMKTASWSFCKHQPDQEPAGTGDPEEKQDSVEEPNEEAQDLREAVDTLVRAQ